MTRTVIASILRRLMSAFDLSPHLYWYVYVVWPQFVNEQEGILVHALLLLRVNQLLVSLFSATFV